MEYCNLVWAVVFDYYLPDLILVLNFLRVILGMIHFLRYNLFPPGRTLQAYRYSIPTSIGNVHFLVPQAETFTTKICLVTFVGMTHFRFRTYSFGKKDIAFQSFLLKNVVSASSKTIILNF